MCRCSLSLMQERLPCEGYRRFRFRNEDLPRPESPLRRERQDLNTMEGLLSLIGRYS
jgi:hypothetical protein